MKKKVNEVELSMDADTLNKVRGKLKPTDKINLTDKQATTSPTTGGLGMTEQTIEPKDQGTIKYLSNVKDSNTGEISKPFTIGVKNYQMVRGITPSKEVVMGVYCHDDINEAGENMIHPMDFFEKTIAGPMKESGDFDYAKAEREYHDQQDYDAAIDAENSRKSMVSEPKKNEPKKEPDAKQESLKLSEFKHFVIDNKTGKVRKFKRSDELAKANMTETESYMNLAQFKKHVDETLFGRKDKKELSEDGTIPDKPDVKLAIQQMLAKMESYMAKINEPLEKIQFLVDLIKMMELDSSKYPMLIAALKKADKSTFGSKSSDTETQTTQTSQVGVNENKVITKIDLINNITKSNVIRTIKVKDIK